MKRLEPPPVGAAYGMLEVLPGHCRSINNTTHVRCLCNVCHKKVWIVLKRLYNGNAVACSRSCYGLSRRAASLNAVGTLIAGVRVTEIDHTSGRLRYKYACPTCKKKGSAYAFQLNNRKNGCLFCAASTKGSSSAARALHAKKYAVGTKHGEYAVVTYGTSLLEVRCRHGHVTKKRASAIKRFPRCCLRQPATLEVFGEKLTYKEMHAAFGLSKQLLRYQQKVHGRSAEEVVRRILKLRKTQE